VYIVTLGFKMVCYNTYLTVRAAPPLYMNYLILLGLLTIGLYMNIAVTRYELGPSAKHTG
jgi:hypothetical protein